MGLKILLPDVNQSAVQYAGAGNAIRIGLMQIRRLTRSLANHIVEERAGRGPYRSLADFLRRVDPPAEQARILVKAGACDGIAEGLSRPALLWRCYAALGRSPVNDDLPSPEEYPESTRVRHEVETLGFPVSRHPLDLFGATQGKINAVQAKDMAMWVGRALTMVGWLVTEKLTQTKQGDPMEFVTFEDTTALYEATFFPQVYRRYAALLLPNRPFILNGVVEEDFGAVTLTVRALRVLPVVQEAAGRPTSEVRRG